MCIRDSRDTASIARRSITARLNEGYSVSDFKRVIDIKVEDWLHDEHMSQFIRPKTLFSNKFDEYLNAVINEKLCDDCKSSIVDGICYNCGRDYNG